MLLHSLLLLSTQSRSVTFGAKQSVTNGAIVIHTQRLKSDPGGNLLS
ncbi:peptide synthetase [Escherichia coli]|nr:peptide synthetase [Escherichia coli]